MKTSTTWKFFAAIVVIAACDSGSAPHSSTAAKSNSTSSATITTLPRTKSLAYFPCADCHKHVQDGDTSVDNPHPSIRPKHMPNAETCSICHNPTNVEELRLASGATTTLDQADVLCGQCHHKERHDWTLGIHGKQVGNWQNKMQRHACAFCHNPHTPKYPSTQTVAPPPNPAMRIKKGAH